MSLSREVCHWIVKSSNKAPYDADILLHYLCPNPPHSPSTSQWLITANDIAEILIPFFTSHHYNPRDILLNHPFLRGAAAFPSIHDLADGLLKKYFGLSEEQAFNVMYHWLMNLVAVSPKQGVHGKKLEKERGEKEKEKEAKNVTMEEVKKYELNMSELLLFYSDVSMFLNFQPLMQLAEYVVSHHCATLLEHASRNQVAAKLTAFLFRQVDCLEQMVNM